MGWALAGLVWGEAISVFLLIDLVKVRFYKVLEHGDIKFHR
jgi:hypothetical protein